MGSNRSFVGRLLDRIFDWVDGGVDRWVWREIERDSLPPQEPTCRHGALIPDCERLCSDCAHPCRAHWPECSAMWSTGEMGFTRQGYETVYKQRRCSCRCYRD